MAAGLVSAGCESEGLSGEPDTAERFDAGTVADREALYDFLVEATMEWDAFASLPNHPYYKRHPKGLDVAEEMEEYREELLAADTDEKMWFVLHKISNIRKDRHLQVTPVEGGLVVPDSLQVELEAPLVFKVDYSDLNDRFFFIADRGIGIEEIVQNRTPELGDRLRSVNGRTVEEYIEAIRPYQRYSSENHFWWHVGAEITRTSSHLPHSDFYDSDLEGVNDLWGWKRSVGKSMRLTSHILIRVTFSGKVMRPGNTQASRWCQEWMSSKRSTSTDRTTQDFR